jgi:hypothetical protein
MDPDAFVRATEYLALRQLELSPDVAAEILHLTFPHPMLDSVSSRLVDRHPSLCLHHGKEGRYWV